MSVAPALESLAPSSLQLHKDRNGHLVETHGSTHTAIAAGFQLLPEGLHVGQIDLVQGDGHLSYRVIPAKTVII